MYKNAKVTVNELTPPNNSREPRQLSQGWVNFFH